ncbi:MAG TPA: zinc metalloprotease [Cytophagales bacterium]|nr:zinc metalloprotease [Cytophagales bacterium]
MNKYIFLLALGVCAHLYSQVETERCATHLLEIKEHVGLEKKKAQFEKSIDRIIAARRLARHSAYDVVTIPVVVHLLHPNLPIGIKQNLSDETVKSQIAVLNKDFRRLNSDTAQTLDQFKPLAADSRIQFCLAQVDPLCNPTTGIVRKNNAKASYSINKLDTLKKLSYWPSDQYLNIWITDLEEGYIGYAKFPYGASLPGLEEGQDNVDPRYDGVVIDFKAFGTVGPNLTDQRFKHGRTTTHEVGHWLGLRHLWGDEDCGTDYCADTPTQESGTTACNRRSDCEFEGTTMMENFMDYTNDICMNLFTIDQVDRMRAVLIQSERRKKLIENNMCSKAPEHAYVPTFEGFEDPMLQPYLSLGPKTALRAHGGLDASSSSIHTPTDTTTTIFETSVLLLNQPIINYLDFDVALLPTGTAMPEGKLLVSYSIGCSGKWTALASFPASTLIKTNSSIPDANSWSALSIDLADVKKNPSKLRFDYISTKAVDGALYIDNLFFSENRKNDLQIRYDYGTRALVLEPTHIGLKDLDIKFYSSEGKYLFEKKYTQIPSGDIHIGEIVGTTGLYLVKVMYDKKAYSFKFANL